MTATCGILFQSQGRSKEFSQSTFVTSLLAVISILAALPWGPAAVAASYSISGLFIRNPIQFHFAAKVSTVTQRDFYAIFVPQVLLGGFIFAAGYGVLHFMEGSAHVVRILTATGVGLAVLGLCLAFSKRQRDSLLLLRKLFRK